MRACRLQQASAVRKRLVATAIVLVVLTGGAVLYARRPKGDRSGGEPPPSAGRSGAARREGFQDRPTAILPAKVEVKDVPIFLEGLGTVAAFNTLTVKSQVDGRINRVVFKEGQEVKKGDLLVEIDPRPFEIMVHRAQAQLSKDQAALKNAQVNLERYRALREQKLIAQQQVDDQQASVDQAAAALDSDRAAIEDAKLQLSYTRITSSIDGRTGVRLVDPGNLVHASDQSGIVIVTQLDPIAVLFTLPQDELPRVQKAQAEKPLEVQAFARDGKTVLGTGQVALIDNQINQSTGTIRLKAIFPNEGRALWPNEFVKARVQVETRKNAMVVPATVVQRGPEGTFAYAVEGDKAVVKRIEVELTSGDQAIISSGLEPGELVVAEGQHRLVPGGKVSIKTATAAAEDGRSPSVREPKGRSKGGEGG
jgi:membrane fusion protein, multidrug efflux system